MKTKRISWKDDDWPLISDGQVFTVGRMWESVLQTGNSWRKNCLRGNFLLRFRTVAQWCSFVYVKMLQRVRAVKVGTVGKKKEIRCHLNNCHGKSDRGSNRLVPHFLWEIGRRVENMYPSTRTHKLLWIRLRLESMGWAGPAQVSQKSYPRFLNSSQVSSEQ